MADWAIEIPRITAFGAGLLSGITPPPGEVIGPADADEGGNGSPGEPRVVRFKQLSGMSGIDVKPRPVDQA